MEDLWTIGERLDWNSGSGDIVVTQELWSCSGFGGGNTDEIEVMQDSENNGSAASNIFQSFYPIVLGVEKNHLIIKPSHHPTKSIFTEDRKIFVKTQINWKHL